MLTLIFFCVFCAITLLVTGLTMKSEHEMLQERVQAQSLWHDTQNAPGADLELPFRQRVVLPFLRFLAKFAGRLTPQGAIQALDEKLETAGHPWRIRAVEFIGLKVLSIIVFTVLGILSVKLMDTYLLKISVLVIGILIGVILPDFLLQYDINKRQSAIRKVLPDTLDLLTVCVESGLGLDAAIQKVVEKLESPLSMELGRALQEMQIGKMRSEALRDMATRLKVAEVTTFVAAVRQAEQFGVSIANVLQVQSETLRSQRSQWAKELASEMPVKMLFPLVFFIFPAIFVVLLAPAAMQIARALSIIK